MANTPLNGLRDAGHETLAPSFPTSTVPRSTGKGGGDGDPVLAYAAVRDANACQPSHADFPDFVFGLRRSRSASIFVRYNVKA